MVAIGTAVVEQKRRISVVCHNHIHESIVIEIGKSDSTTHVGSFKARTGQLANFSEFAVPFVVEQRIDLLVMSPRRGLLNLGIDMAVGDKNIQPTIVVIIEETSAETEHIACRPRDAGLIADLVKKSFVFVVPKVI